MDKITIPNNGQSTEKVKRYTIMFENVPGLMTVNHGEDFSNLLEFIENETGYQLYRTKLNAHHLNSFMYEPILDMSLIHLYDLYNKVKQL